MQAMVGEFNVSQWRRRRLPSVQHLAQARDQQAVFDGIQPFWALRVTGPHFMLPAVAVGKVAGHCHGDRLRPEFFVKVASWKHNKSNCWLIRR
jgi:uncharacterized membrane protein